MQNWIHHFFWRVGDFFKSWIYPALRLQNFFIHRYDIVRMPQLERSRYYDVKTRMYHAVMELVRYYYEECQKQFNWRDDFDKTIMQSIGLDRNHTTATSAKQLQRDATCAGKEVECCGFFIKINVSLKNIKQVLLSKICCRTCLEGTRHIEMPTLVFACYNSHSVVLGIKRCNCCNNSGLALLRYRGCVFSSICKLFQTPII